MPFFLSSRSETWTLLCLLTLFSADAIWADDRPVPQAPPPPRTLDDFDASALERIGAARRRDESVARIRRGKELLAGGRTAEAIREFNTALKLEPGMPEAVYRRGVAIRRLGLFDEALEQMERGMKVGVVDRDAQAIRAAILYRLGRYDEALAIRDREVQLNPGDLDERLYRAELYAAMGRERELRQDLEFIYARAPNRREACEASIRKIAISRDARLAAARQGDPAAAYDVANKLFWAERHAEAAEWYARTAQLKPDHVDALCGAAEAYQRAGNPAVQAWFATRVLRLDPRHAEARTSRGWAWRHLRHFELAEREFNAAVAADPTYAPAWLGRGRLYYECFVNRTRAAQLDFDRAVDLAPKDPQVWMARGVFLLEYAPAFVSTQGLSIDRAYNPPYVDFSRAIDLDPKRTKAYVHRAITLAAWGRPDAAKRDLDKAFELEPWAAGENARFVRQTLQDMRQAERAGRELMEALASGAQGGPPPVAGGGDDSVALRAKWNKDTALDNASKAGDRGAYERIQRDEGTWRDRSRYGG